MKEEKIKYFIRSWFVLGILFLVACGITEGEITATETALVPTSTFTPIPTSVVITTANVHQMAQLTVLEGHTNIVIDLAWSPDGNKLASASEDETVRIWDAESGAELAVLEGHTSWVESVAWSPDGRLLASAGADETVRIWDVESRAELAVLEEHFGYVYSVSWSPDGSKLASAGADKTVRIWGLSNE